MEKYLISLPDFKYYHKLWGIVFTENFLSNKVKKILQRQKNFYMKL